MAEDRGAAVRRVGPEAGTGEAGAHRDRGAGGDRGGEEGQAGHVVQRQYVKGGVGGGQAEPLHHLGGRHDQAVVGDQAALGAAGGARREQDRGGSAAVVTRPDRRPLGAHVPGHVDHGGTGRGQLLTAREHGQIGARLVQYGGQFGVGEPRVQGDHDGAESGRGEPDTQQIRAVGQHHGDPGADAGSGRAQLRGGAAGGLVTLGVGQGDPLVPPVPPAEERAVGVGLRGGGELGEDGRRGRCGHGRQGFGGGRSGCRHDCGLRARR